MGEKWTTVACAVGWERVALRVGNYVVGDGCTAGWKRMGLIVDSKTKWLRAALLDGLQGGRKVDEGCASRLGGKLQAGRKVDNGCAASQVRGDW